MTLGADKFMRRFLLHVLPRGFHRIRRYGLLANGNRMASLALARALLGQPGAAPLAVENTHTPASTAASLAWSARTAAQQ